MQAAILPFLLSDPSLAAPPQHHQRDLQQRQRQKQHALNDQPKKLHRLSLQQHSQKPGEEDASPASNWVEPGGPRHGYRGTDDWVVEHGVDVGHGCARSRSGASSGSGRDGEDFKGTFPVRNGGLGSEGKYGKVADFSKAIQRDKLILDLRDDVGKLEGRLGRSDSLRWVSPLKDSNRNRDVRFGISRLSQPNVYSWSAIILAHVKLRQNEKAIEFYHKMQNSSVEHDDHVIVAVLKACSNVAALDEGKQVHARTIESGLELDVFVGNSLIDMYHNCGSLQDARTVFSILSKPDIVSWNTLIAGYVEHQCGEEALQIFRQMQLKGMQADRFTFFCLIKVCSMMAALELGKQIHGSIIASGFESDVSIGTSLINMYGKCRSLEYALIAFNRLQKPDLSRWNALLAEYVQLGQNHMALQLFQQMQEVGTEPNLVTFIFLLKACSGMASLSHGQQIHSLIIKSGLDLGLCAGNIVIDMYRHCGSPVDAHRVFHRLPARDVVTWSALIAGYTENGHCLIALQLFEQMQQEGMEPNQVTFVCILKACSNIGALEQGQQIHARVLDRAFESNIFVGNTLIDMYGKCGSLEDAIAVFARLPSRDIITWNVLIAAYTHCGHSNEAFQTFQQMHQEGMEPNLATFISILKACSTILVLKQGKNIHTEIIKCGFESDLCMGNTLIDMYSKCGSLDDASMVFGRLPKQDVVTWNVLIAGYVQHGYFPEALQLFQQMQLEGMELNQVTFVSMLKACSSAAALEQGRHIHHYMIDRGLETGEYVGTALIGMYGKCENLEGAISVFERLQKQSIASWNALIAVCAQHSNYTVAFQVFEDLLRLGLNPNDVTFLCLLSACGHVGKLMEGCLYFKLMRDKYCISPTLEHYTSMVDLLGRVRCFKEAEDLLDTFPFPSCDVGWRSLLSSCRTYNIIDVGRRSFNHVMALEPQKAAAYVLMSDIYARAGLRKHANEIEELRRRTDV